MGATYHLLVHGESSEPVRVSAFRARESMNSTYEVVVECFADPRRDIVGELLGRRATLVMNVAEQPSSLHGVIHRVGLLGVGSGDTSFNASASFSLTIGPRLWLLRKNRHSRVFQGKSVDQIVKEVLDGASIPSLFLLQNKLPIREYCTQYEETDEEFVLRLMAEAGIMVYFLQPALPPMVEGAGAILDTVLGALRSLPIGSDLLNNLGIGSLTGEVMVFADDVLGYHGIGEAPEGLDTLIQAAVGRVGDEIAQATGQVGASAVSAARAAADLGISALGATSHTPTSRALRYVPTDDAGKVGDRDVVRRFAIEHSIQSESAVFTTFDPRRPLQPLTFSASGDGALSQLASLVGQVLPAGVSGVLGKAAQVVGTGAAAISAVAQAAGVNKGPFGDALGAIGNVARQFGGGSGSPNFGGADLTVHENHDPFLVPDWDYARTEPRRILSGERRDRRVGRGESPCPLLTCGHRFTLEHHPVDWVNREYAVVEVIHEGHAYFGREEQANAPLYRNEFVCVPSDIVYAPMRPPRRTVQAQLTATVITPGDAELATRGMAEIKVRFHWDAARTGTCWIRMMQAWSGVGFGAQFMPRAGTEVVVGFDGGDPDRPIGLGCLYNAVNPTPFPLPADQTRSGFRTQSTPKGDGGNELSFEDRRGNEVVHVHAKRDMTVEVEHDRSALVQHDDMLEVQNDQRVTVKGVQEVRVESGQDIVVREHRRLEVEGADFHVTRGHRQDTVIGSHITEVRGTHQSSYGSGAGESIEGDFTRQTTGCVAELVRDARAVRVEGASEHSARGPNVLESDAEVLIRCGESMVCVTKKRIELIAPEIIVTAKGASISLGSGKISQLADGTWQAIGDKALLVSSGASVGLSSEAKVDGSQILLNSPDRANDKVEPEKKPKTVIELKDDKGKPIPHQRYRIELADGTSRTGALDEKGRAEVFVDGSAEVLFPDLAEVNPS